MSHLEFILQFDSYDTKNRIEVFNNEICAPVNATFKPFEIDVMQGQPEVLNTLNATLKLEITAINQFFLHSRIVKNWGLQKLAEHNYAVSITSMKTSDALIERILFLEGAPYMQHLDELAVGRNVAEMMQRDLSLMQQTRSQYVESMTICEQHIDYESRSLLNSGLNFTEEQIDWLESQQWQIDALGLENYLQTQIGEQVQ